MLAVCFVFLLNSTAVLNMNILILLVFESYKILRSQLPTDIGKIKAHLSKSIHMLLLFHLQDKRKFYEVKNILKQQKMTLYITYWQFKLNVWFRMLTMAIMARVGVDRSQGTGHLFAPPAWVEGAPDLGYLGCLSKHTAQC